MEQALTGNVAIFRLEQFLEFPQVQVIYQESCSLFDPINEDDVMNSSHLLNGTESQAVDIDLLFDTARLAAGLQKCSLQSQLLLSSVFDFIEAHYQDSISLREVALAVGRSPAHLTDLVRRETGKTVLSWIVSRRMAEARRLLLETSQSVEQIAEAVGYFDRRHFSRQFLRLHESTPQTWRKTHQSKSSSLLQIDPHKAISSKLIKHKAKTMTSAEAQRLQVCVQEIAAILYKNTGDGEVLTLEGEE